MTRTHAPSRPGVGLVSRIACLPESGCAKGYAAQSMHKGFVSKWRIAFREQLREGEDGDQVEKKENRCSSVLVESYHTRDTKRNKGE